MVDWAIALESVNADSELLVDVVKILLDEIPNLHNDLRSATFSKDTDAIQNAAHKFKGSVRFLGPNTVYDLAEGIELLEPMDLGQANELLSKLNDETELLSTSLKEFIAKSEG